MVVVDTVGALHEMPIAELVLVPETTVGAAKVEGMADAY